MGEDLSGKTFAILGLSFKPKTDDMREAPSIVIIEHLLAQGANVVAYDPQAMEVTREHILKDRIKYAKNAYETIDGADALVLVTEWSEFRSLDLSRLKSSMKGLHIFDGRNIYVREEVEAKGFIYTGVGC
jgi:UDPglucose 6-dehydrogenase